MLIILKNFNPPRHIAAYLREKLNLDSGDEEVAIYSLEMIYYSILGIFLLCFFGWLLNCLMSSIIISAVAMLFRSASGGAHSSSPYSCIITSAVAVSLSGKITSLFANNITLQILILLVSVGLLVSFIVVWRLAPDEAPNKPITSLSHRKQLRMLSVIFVILAAILQCGLLVVLPLEKSAAPVLAIEAGLLWQVFSLTKTGHNFIDSIDNVFLMKGGGKGEKVK